MQILLGKHFFATPKKLGVQVIQYKNANLVPAKSDSFAMFYHSCPEQKLCLYTAYLSIYGNKNVGNLFSI